MCNLTNHKSYGSLITAVTEVHKHAVYMATFVQRQAKKSVFLLKKPFESNKTNTSNNHVQMIASKTNIKLTPVPYYKIKINTIIIE